MIAHAQTLIMLADAFGAAALDRKMWLPALQLLADATRSARGQLIGIGGADVIPFNWVTDFPERALDEFVEIDGGNPAINPRVHAALGSDVLQVLHEEHLRAAEPSLASTVYLDFARDNDIPNGCQTKLAESNEGLIGLAVLRTASDGNTTPMDRAVFAEAARHARTAVRIGTTLGADAPRLLAGALEAVAAAAFICDHSGRIAALTPAAERLGRTGKLSIAAGRLSTADVATANTLQAALARMAQDGARGGVVSVAIPQPPSEPPLVLDIAPVPIGTWGFDLSPRLLVLARGRHALRQETHSLLRSAYPLTAAEAAVAAETARGQSRELIAAARGVSVETIRTQLKSIFAKLGVSREIELALLLAPLLEAKPR